MPVNGVSLGGACRPAPAQGTACSRCGQRSRIRADRPQCARDPPAQPQISGTDIDRFRLAIGKKN